MILRRIKLSKEERQIEDSIHEYVPVSRDEFEEIAQAVSRRRKDAVLNIRINKQDLENIKQKAKRLGIKYQAFIAEILHKVAHA